MKYGELRVGARYILKGRARTVAVFEGKHTGTLELADGATYDGAQGALKFRITDEQGNEKVALFENAGSVEEPEETRIEREAAEVALRAAKAAAFAEAQEFLTSLGLLVTDRRGWWDLTDEQRSNAVNISESFAMADEIDVDGVSVGMLKRIIHRIATGEAK